MRFYSILSKASTEAFFSDAHTCTAAQLIYMYSALCLVYMTCKDTSLLLRWLTKCFFVLEILASFCFAGTKLELTLCSVYHLKKSSIKITGEEKSLLKENTKCMCI